MKNSHWLTDRSYRPLRRKLFFQTIILMPLPVAAVLFLRILSRGKVADAIVDFLCGLGLEWYQAVHLYQVVIRNNLETLLQLGIVTAMVLFFAGTVVWFTHYFDQIIQGVEKLASGSKEEIKLSPELDFMERKLRAIRQQLDAREKAARLAEQRKNDLVMYLAHDMRTPLTSVIGYLSLLEENPQLEEEERERYTHVALEKAERLSGLMNEFFDITRLNLQAVSLNRKPLDLVLLLNQLAEELYPAFRKRGMDVRLEGPPSLMIYGDPQLLVRAFGNLLKNAAAYGESHTPLVVCTGCQHGKVSVSFQNACSIPEGMDLEKLFQRFHRLDDARSTKTGGAGLGLAIAREIISSHGGALTAARWKNGIVFEVRLPLEPLKIKS